jgi:hypothetical protein
LFKGDGSAISASGSTSTMVPSITQLTMPPSIKVPIGAPDNADDDSGVGLRVLACGLMGHWSWGSPPENSVDDEAGIPLPGATGPMGFPKVMIGR